MPIPNNNQLIIKGYVKDPTEPSGYREIKRFKAAIQPESISHKKSIQYSQNDTANTNHNKKQYHGYATEVLDMQLVIDSGDEDMNTSASIADKDPVVDKVKELEDTIYNYEGSIHKPLFLEVLWKNLDFYCHLKNIDIKYYLFDGNGKPTRAKISLSFESYTSPEYAERRGNNQSPDMTHVKTFREGDNILAMSRDVYGDSKYFVQVAEYNDLINFRNIKPGTQLIFPPLK